MKKNNLTVDLSDFLSEKVSEQIKSLEQEIADKKSEIKELNDSKKVQFDELNRYITEIKTENNQLKTDISKYSSVNSIFVDIKNRFNKITNTKESDDDWARTKSHNQFRFITDLMKNLYGVSPVKGHNFCTDSKFELNLAVAFYNDKERIMELIRFLFDDPTGINFRIKEFKMPYDYTREGVLKIIKNPQTHTNGEYFGFHRYWLSYGAAEKNIPYDFLLKNKFIADDEIFNELIKNSTRAYTDGHNLFTVTDYNDGLTDEQITRLGRELMKFDKTQLKWKGPAGFFNKNKDKLDTQTLDYLFKFIEGDRYGHFSWSNFPEKYQIKFFKDKSIGQIVKALNEESPKWTTEKIDEFFNKFASDKVSSLQ